MTIEEVREEQKKLEDNMLIIINAFEKLTGVIVHKAHFVTQENHTRKVVTTLQLPQS